jgi:hypothetical protein
VNPFTKSSSRFLAVNRRAVLANKCVCGSYLTFCALVGLPPIVSKHSYQQHMAAIEMGARAEVKDSLRRVYMVSFEPFMVQAINSLVSCGRIRVSLLCSSLLTRQGR